MPVSLSCCGRIALPFTGGQYARERERPAPLCDGRTFEDGKTTPVPFRYVWPSELDLMAQLAHMTVPARWATGTADRSPARATTRLGLAEAGCGVSAAACRICRPAAAQCAY
jgi:hypothetical protein